MPPASRNHRVPTAGDTPALTAASSLEWPVVSEALPEEPTVADEESEPASDEALWSRSRDFDWGD